jgi:hypothetical protein
MALSDNPYQSPHSSCDSPGPTAAFALRVLSGLIVGTAALFLALLVVGLAVAYFQEARHDGLFGLVPLLACFILYAIPVGAIALPQFLSVFRMSLRAARVVSWVSKIGIWFALTAAITYPMIELVVDTSPPGAELLGLIGFSMLAGFLLLNLRLHRRWIGELLTAQRSTI